MAFGDFNIDGAVDVLFAVNNDASVLLKNVAARGNRWLGVRLVGKKANPDGIGARIIWQAGDLKRSRLKVGGGSYLSSHDRSEEYTSELQSHLNLVCRLLLEKKNN